MTGLEEKSRLLAVDFGERRTGLAATDFTGRICVPLDRVDHADIAGCVAEVAAVARNRGSQRLVVGLPLDAEGGIGHRASRVVEFIEALRRALPDGVDVVTVDETYSTDEAHARLKASGMKAARRKQLADSISALVILERYRAGPSPRDC